MGTSFLKNILLRAVFAAATTMPLPKATAQDADVDSSAQKATGFEVRFDEADDASNAALLAAARANADAILDATAGRDARHAAEMEKDVQQWLAESGAAFFTRAVVIDSDRIDKMVALGFGQDEAVRHDLQRRGVENIDDRLVKNVATAIGADGGTVAGILGPVDGPRVIEHGDTAVFVPPVAASLPLLTYKYQRAQPLPGDTVAEAAQFFDAHEKSHIRHPLNAVITAREQKNDDAFFALHHRQEARGDLDGIGEMLCTNGKGTEYFDTVLAYRHSDQTKKLNDHDTGTVIRAMKETVTGMGKDAYCAMPDKNRDALHEKLVAEHGLTEKSVRYFNDYNEGGPFIRWRLRKNADDDKDIAKALAVYNDFSAAEAENRQFIKDRAAHEGADRAALADMEKTIDANGMQRAWQQSARDPKTGQVTPQSLLAAYTRMKDALAEKIVTDPAAQLEYEQAAQLRFKLRGDGSGFNYARVNREAAPVAAAPRAAPKGG
jgi:hypothetical protein